MLELGTNIITIILKKPYVYSLNTSHLKGCQQKSLTKISYLSSNKKNLFNIYEASFGSIWKKNTQLAVPIKQENFNVRLLNTSVIIILDLLFQFSNITFFN